MLTSVEATTMLCLALSRGATITTRAQVKMLALGDE